MVLREKFPENEDRKPHHRAERKKLSNHAMWTRSSGRHKINLCAWKGKITTTRWKSELGELSQAFFMFYLLLFNFHARANTFNELFFKGIFLLLKSNFSLWRLDSNEFSLIFHKILRKINEHFKLLRSFLS
jgi:hypothetical protein